MAVVDGCHVCDKITTLHAGTTTAVVLLLSTYCSASLTPYQSNTLTCLNVTYHNRHQHNQPIKHLHTQACAYTCTRTCTYAHTLTSLMVVFLPNAAR